jgi:DNA-directed RNA polymerase I, II, and III subunit RPABC3
MSRNPGVYVQDNFEVKEVDPGGKKFDKVSRIRANSDLLELEVTLDVNSDLFPVEVADTLAIAISGTLYKDGTNFSDYYDVNLATTPAKETYLNDYEYVMHGTIFKTAENKGSGMLRLDVFISFGGLLMQITGNAKELEQLEADRKVFLLMRKIV